MSPAWATVWKGRHNRRSVRASFVARRTFGALLNPEEPLKETGASGETLSMQRSRRDYFSSIRSLRGRCTLEACMTG